MTKKPELTLGKHEEKARILTEAAYARTYDGNNAEMAGEVDSLLAHVARNGTVGNKSVSKWSSFSTSAAHAVLWSACGSVFSCTSGTTCQFMGRLGRCAFIASSRVGRIVLLVAWSTSSVPAGFFSTTYTACNEEVEAEGKTSASCEGYGSWDQDGDVCISNRASGCT